MFKISQYKTNKLIISSAMYIVVLILVYFFVGRLVFRYAEKIKSQFHAKTAELKESYDLIQSFPKQGIAIEDIEKKTLELKDRSATKGQISRVVREVTNKTRDSGVAIVSIRPREDIKSDYENLPVGVNKVFIELQVRATYERIEKYFEALSQMQIILTIESVSLEKDEPAQVKGELSVNLIVSTFTI